jgi:ATP-dependent DNA helicase RecG
VVLKHLNYSALMTSAANIETMAAAGESETLEFKATTGKRNEAAKTLSAMLNGQGGTVLFGVRSDGKVVGQQVAESTLVDITQACTMIHPQFPPSIERVEVPGGDGVAVIAVAVPAGKSKPYRHKDRYFVRSGASTVVMPTEIQLSLVLEGAHSMDRWEFAPSDRDIEALDEDEVLLFRDQAIANQRGPFSSTAGVPDVLRALQLLDADAKPNRAAIALFGRGDFLAPEYMTLGCHLAAADDVRFGEYLRDEEIVEQNAFASMRRAIAFCRTNLKRPVSIDGVQASSDLEIPESTIREALANAFAHRDYATGGRVQVHIFADRLEVISPGGLHFGLTASDLYRPHNSHPWNPLMLGAFYRRGYVDQLGTGTLRMMEECASAGRGRPIISDSVAGVVCSIPRSGYWITDSGLGAPVGEVEASMLKILADGPLPRRSIAATFGLPGSVAKVFLTGLRDKGLAHPEGHGRGACWTLGPDADPPL